MFFVRNFAAVVIAIVAAVACNDASASAPVAAPAPAPQAVPVAPSQPAPTAPALSRDDVLRARRQYKVQVLSIDTSQHYGSGPVYSDRVRLRIKNESKATLPCLTILTKRFAKGTMVGSSRAPSIPVRDLHPGDNVEYDYYPLGHLDVANVDKIQVEIEGLIDPAVEQFFCELHPQ